MEYILNMTQHAPNDEQREAGLIEMDAVTQQKIRDLLTFDEMPTAMEVSDRAEALAQMAWDIGIETVHIGGAPFLMPTLVEALEMKGMQPVFSFSKRIVEEKDGVKKSKFVFEGFLSVD